MLSRCAFLMGTASLLAIGKARAWLAHGSGVPIPSNVWMETPDVLAFYVDDAPLNKGNTVTLTTPDPHAYNTWFSATTPTATYISAMTCFNNMINVNNTSGGNQPSSAIQNIVAHMSVVITNGIAASRSSTYLQALQGHVQWMMGANQPGKCMTTRLGVRSTNELLHEDQQKMGVSAPPGVVSFGYSAWAGNGTQAFNGAGVNTDNTSTFVADNITGSHETDLQPGSTKMWSNWRYGESYWEHNLECRGSTPISEFALAPNIGALISSLYCHGWDGNV